jgi:hypothetical protein
MPLCHHRRKEVLRHRTAAEDGTKAIAMTMASRPKPKIAEKEVSMANEKLTPTWKFLIGMLGSISPTIVLWYLGKLTIGNFTFFSFLGWLAPNLAMACLSGFITRYYDEEHPLKLFYVGITAPSLILNLALPPGSAPVPPKNPFSTTSLWSVSVANAQPITREPKKETQVKKLERPTIGEQIQQGISQALGRQEGKWFVIVGSYKKLENAQKQVETLQKLEAHGFKPEIYTYPGSKYYAVTIGANLTFEEAKELKERSQSFGPIIPKDTYLWRLE